MSLVSLNTNISSPLAKKRLLPLQDVKNAIFINCGGTDDVTEVVQSKENTRITIIDSRRYMPDPARPSQHPIRGPQEGILHGLGASRGGGGMG